MISLDKQIPDYYTQEHKELALAFAAQAAIAIQNARLFAETQRRAAQQEALNTIIAAAATALDLPGLVATSMDRILTATGLQQGGIWAAGHHHRVSIPRRADGCDSPEKGGMEAETPITLAVEDWNGSDVPELVNWMVKTGAGRRHSQQFLHTGDGGGPINRWLGALRTHAQAMATSGSVAPAVRGPTGRHSRRSPAFGARSQGAGATIAAGAGHGY